MVTEREFVTMAKVEYMNTRAKYPPMNSAHEGWAVIHEEVDELWEWVKKKPCDRSGELMMLECVQIAAMAMRFAVELTNGKETEL